MIAQEHCNDWNALAQELRPFVAHRVRPEEVDDVLQEVFLRLHKSADTLRDRERFGPWVYRVARSAVTDQLRARRRREQREAARTQGTAENTDPIEALAVEPCEDPASAEVEAERVQEDVSRFVAMLVVLLPSPYREAITLTELEGLSQREAAEALGVPVPTLKSRVQRGRAQLRTFLEQACVLALDARGRLVGCTPRTAATMPEGCCGSKCEA